MAAICLCYLRAPAGPCLCAKPEACPQARAPGQTQRRPLKQKDCFSLLSVQCPGVVACLADNCLSLGTKAHSSLPTTARRLWGIPWAVAAKTGTPHVCQSPPQGDTGPLECGKERKHLDGICQDKEGGEKAKWCPLAKARQRESMNMLPTCPWALDDPCYSTLPWLDVCPSGPCF